MDRRGLEYEKADHAAAHTRDFVFQQLIPYIGNKRKLLGLIHDAIAMTGCTGGSFVDLFAGSGVVSRMAKKLGFAVWANDWEPYAEAINTCAIACNSTPWFAWIGGYEKAIATLNAVAPRVGWITKHLCPDDDERFDVGRDRMFYTRANGMILDAMRDTVEDWRRAGRIDECEFACLLAPMLYQACYTSNTSGVFKGFHNGWGGQTKTALYRIRSRFQLRPFAFHDNGQVNTVTRQDATALAATLRNVDIAYLDPPYNQHPYGSNYHVLNTVTLRDAPPLTPKIEGRNKSAIRMDWRTERRSAYNHRGDAARAYRELLDRLDARFILTSYSTDGTIALDELVSAACERGATRVVMRQYKRYRVSSQRYSHKPVNVEFVLVTKANSRKGRHNANAICAAIRQQETAALKRHPESTSRAV